MAEISFCKSVQDFAYFVEQYARSIACIGVFDGFHRGHAYLVDECVSHASSVHVPSLIITFDKDPDELFAPQSLKKLSSNQRRIERLSYSQADAVLVLPFSFEFASLSPDSFLAKVVEPLQLTGLHIGSNFRFGHKAAGDVSTLREWGASHQCEVIAHDLLDDQGQLISASTIRSLLAQPNLLLANELLGYSFTLSGCVLCGRGQGEGFGFKTANLSIPSNQMALCDGVYAACVPIDNILYNAAVSVGFSPTFQDETTANIEAHILDFDGDLYDRDIDIEFDTYLRPMIAFPDTKTLIKTVQSNIAWVREHGRGSLARKK